MQTNKPKFNRVQAFGLLFLIIVVLGLGIWLVSGLFSQKPSTEVTASKLPCSYSETIRPFGENVLYYDGMSIHCMSSTGGVRWSFPSAPMPILTVPTIPSLHGSVPPSLFWMKTAPPATTTT